MLNGRVQTSAASPTSVTSALLSVVVSEPESLAALSLALSATAESTMPESTPVSVSGVVAGGSSLQAAKVAAQAQARSGRRAGRAKARAARAAVVSIVGTLAHAGASAPPLVGVIPSSELAMMGRVRLGGVAPWRDPLPLSPTEQRLAAWRQRAERVATLLAAIRLGRQLEDGVERRVEVRTDLG